MIIGIGTDIVQIKRIENIYLKYGKIFLEKNFHELEIEKFNLLNKQEKINFLAKRFAAKEAFSKALGTGIGHRCNFKDIAVLNDSLGAPKILISEEKFPNFLDFKIYLSLSDDYPIAVAFVVITR